MFDNVSCLLLQRDAQEQEDWDWDLRDDRWKADLNTLKLDHDKVHMIALLGCVNVVCRTRARGFRCSIHLRPFLFG